MGDWEMCDLQGKKLVIRIQPNITLNRYMYNCRYLINHYYVSAGLCWEVEVIYQTRKTVFDHISKHRELKIRRAVEYIRQTLRCLEMRSSTVSSD